MKNILCILLLFVALSGVKCGRISAKSRKSYFLDNDDDAYLPNGLLTGQMTNEVHLPLKKGPLVGAPRSIDVHDSYANKLLTQHLRRLVTGDKREILIDAIEEITQQVVAGSLFRIKGEYEVEGSRKFCTISILSQPWTTGNDQVVISAKCDDGSCYVTETYTCSPNSLYGAPHVSQSERMLLFA